jgi:hypothetical protein
MLKSILINLVQLVLITSGQSDNNLMGLPLRPFNEKPIFHQLVARIEGKVMAGKRLTMWVTLKESNGEIVSCQWTTPLGVTFIVDRDKLRTIDGKIF